MPPATRGRTRRKRWGYQRHHPLQAVRGAVGAVYELPKKSRGPTLCPNDAFVPSPKGNGTNLMEEIPTGRRHHDKTSLLSGNQEKGAVPPAPSSTHCPSTEEATEGSLGIHLLVVAITTKRILGSVTREKAEVPPTALFDAFISYG